MSSSDSDNEDIIFQLNMRIETLEIANRRLEKKSKLLSASIMNLASLLLQQRKDIDELKSVDGHNTYDAIPLLKEDEESIIPLLNNFLYNN